MIESFNGRLRDECINVHAFESIDDWSQLRESIHKGGRIVPVDVVVQTTFRIEVLAGQPQAPAAFVG